MNEEPTTPQWVCTDCFVALVNGDVSPDVEEPEKLMSLFEGMHTTPGLTQEHHSCGRENDSYFGECDCETRSFSWSWCDGCDSNLGGERHAVTGWIPVKEGKS